MSYGPNLPDLHRRAGDFVDKILKGSRVAELPVEHYENSPGVCRRAVVHGWSELIGVRVSGVGYCRGAAPGRRSQARRSHL